MSSPDVFKQPDVEPQFHRRVIAAGAMALALTGCAAPQTHDSAPHADATQSVEVVPRTVAPTPLETAQQEHPPYALPQTELASIISATGFNGLKGHSVTVYDSFTGTSGRFVVGGIDGAKPLVPITEIKKDVALAEALAATRPSFITDVQLGPKTNFPVAYEVSPAASSNTAKRYIFFAAATTDITALAFPRQVSPSAYTEVIPDGMNVSIIRDSQDKLPLNLDPNSLDTATEALQACTTVLLKDASAGQIDAEKPDLSYVTRPGEQGWVPPLINIGREQFNNSWAFAHQASLAGIPYNTYRTAAEKTVLHGYERNQVNLFAVDTAAYADFRQSSP